MNDQVPPNVDSRLSLPDGRHVAWCEWGAPHDEPVLFLHRAPGSRLINPSPRETASARVRLITFDRPGYGGTDPVALLSRAAVADDAAALVDDLGLERVAILGWSGGGQFAIDVAARLGKKVRSLGLLCTPAPDEEVPWVPAYSRPLVALAKTDPRAAFEEAMASLTSFAEHPDAQSLGDTSPADARVRAVPEIRERLDQMVRESARQGAKGLAFDMIAGSRGEPFPFSEVRCPVHLWYGADDPIGPPHGRWYSKQFRKVDFFVVPDAGHLLPMTHWKQILAAARR
jgi:pimeloyl-ACP methyl ester carboxylesterase